MDSAKVALITGAGQGIGKGIAQRLRQAGMRVAIAEQDPEAGAESARELGTAENTLFVPMNTADEGSVQAGIARLRDRFGRLDALVNNAGIADPYNDPVETLALVDWRRILDVNLGGYFLCAKHAIPHLRASRGAIINIASTRALQSEPNSEAYAAAKGGIVALTHALAISLGPAIRVNCISPGWIAVSDWQKSSRRRPPELRPIDAEQHPVGRVGHPPDVAALAAFLLSDEAGFISGQNFVVDGGMTRKMIYAE